MRPLGQVVRPRMRHSRQAPWLIVVLLASLAAPTPRLAGALLAARDVAGSPIGGKPPELRGRNRIGDLPVARSITDEAPRRDVRRRGRPVMVRLALAPTIPRLRPDGPGATPRIVLHLRC